MTHKKNITDRHRPARDEILKYDYHLSTLYEISRDLFGELDIEVILRNFMLTTMGIVGATECFILVADPRSGKVRRFVQAGCSEVDRDGLQTAALEVLLDDKVEEPIVSGTEADRFDSLPQPARCLIKFEVDGGRSGIMVLGPKLVEEPYSAEELKLLDTLKNNMVVALRNARSFAIINRLNADLLEKKSQLENTVEELRVAKDDVEQYSRHLERIIAALNVAQEVQQSLLPRTSPQEKSCDIAGTSLYCDQTGGDYYDFIELPRFGAGVHALAVGDVSGHGVSSALLMAGVRAYLRSRIMQAGSAAEIISDVNRLVSADTEQTCQFMTLFFLVVDTRARRLSWVNAGHDPAIVYHTGRGEFSQLAGGDIPLGVEDAWDYRVQEAEAESGQVVVLTTDGVWECRNGRGEMFGKERLLEIIRKNAHLDAAGLRTAVVEAVRAFIGESPQEDDITLVICKFL